MSRWIFIGVASLFLFKICSNIAIPYILFLRGLRKGADPRSGISIVPMMDVVLLASASVAAAVTDGRSWGWSAPRVAIVGAAFIVGSYLHIFFAGAVVWCIRRLKRTKD